MQKYLLLLLCGAALLFNPTTADAQKQSSASVASYREGVVRVKLQPELATAVQKASLPDGTIHRKAKAQHVTTGVSQLDRVAQRVKAVRMKRVFPYAGKDEAKHKAAGLDLWYDVTYTAADMSPMQARNLYRSTAGVQYAQRIPVYQPYGGEKFRPVSAADIARATKAASAMPFNDPLLPAQWHYFNDGSLQGTLAGADANIFKAWQTGVTGNKDVVVAIIDGGFQIDHPDLKDNLWINEAELNGNAGVDDDGNGFVDDVYGYNFVINSANINAHSHGTHVAGTVGATNGNGIGVSGVAGGNGSGGVKMMVCQVFDSRASSSAEADFGAALVYAADRGASIAQCSWGMGMPDEEDKSVSEAVRYFTRNGGGDKMNGGLCIFAAGNNGEEGNFFPGCLDEVVAVGSMGADGYVTSYSNYGKWVDVTAPGGLMDYGQQYGVLSTLPNSTYGYNEGTSMACPHVSGIAALILSKYGNKNFSNETLRTLLTTSVNDLYTLNPDYVGKMGSGYIDAYKALQGKEGSVPSAVSDFTITASHDNALIEWVIPESEEKSIDHHVIYYSTEAFTATDNLSRFNSVSVDTKFKLSGDPMSYELKGLKASTKYYFAIVAYNRWGKASAVSPVKEATTNAGPKVKLDKTALTMAVDAASSPTAETAFNITNSGEGMLKYQLTAATTRAIMSTKSRATNPSPGQVLPFSGTVAPTLAKSNAVASSDYYAKDWPVTLTYAEQLYSYLGESDTKLPNALAQYFYVDKAKYPNGFNLTAVKFQGQRGENPVIEIYDGSRSISTASLLQRVSYTSWAYNYNILLGEQIYFAPGTSFWVVAKFPAGAKNPLGASKTSVKDVAQYSFYSSNNGATWTQLSEVLKGSSFEAVSDRLTWAVFAISQNPDWSQVLNPEPISGEVRPGESQTVTLKNDGQKLVNGTYKFNIHVKSNEAVDSKQKVALTMNVNGYLPEIHSQQLVDFGNLLVGQTKTIDVELTNSGYGVFGGDYGYLQANKNITSSSDQFDVSAGMQSVSARSTGKLPVKFKPTKAGNFTSNITIVDKNNIKHTFVVRGVASATSNLEIAKSEFDLGDLKVGGETKTATFTVKNTGEYPLQYVFPKYSSANIEGNKTRVHKFGYTIISNVGDDTSFNYEPAPELADEQDITAQFNSNNWQSGPVKVGFKFPFYGKEYEEVYISSYGGLSMLPIEGRISCMVPTGDCVEGLGYVSAYTNSGWMDMGGNSKITYGHKDGKFYVKFKDVVTPATNGGGETTTLSFHMALCPDGSVEVFYDDYDPAGVFGSGGNNFVGVSDIASKDACVFTDATMVHSSAGGYDAPYYDITSGSAIKIVAPAKSMIKSVSSTDGYIGNGDSKDITVTLEAGDNLYAGELINYLTILTNDPAHSSTNITLKANIIGDNLKAEAATDVESVDFGNVFRTSVQTHNVLLSNNGKDALHVSGISVKDGKFTVADEVKGAFDVPAGQGKDITVTLPTEVKGAVEDVLVINFTDNTSLQVALKGNVIGTPIWSTNTEEVALGTPYGENISASIDVTNNGDEPLTFAAEPENWYRALDVAEDGESLVDYIFRSKSDGFDVPFNWVDITEDYTEHMPYSYYIDKTDFKKVTLPFEFPFYGKKYKEMYIYNTGFVSFDEPLEDYKQFPEPPASLPTTETFYSNIICPFWGNHSMNTPSADGVYYKANEDNVVVTYKNYGNTMMSGMNFQVILRKDGSFKFQYSLDPEGMQIGVFGLCGIMDHTETRGITPSDMYITSGNALEFTPYKNYVVKPGTSTELPIELFADKLADTYSYELTLNTNAPANKSVKIPVVLDITGEANAVFPTEINAEQVASEFAMIPIRHEFVVENKGTRAFTIDDVASPLFAVENPDDPWAMPEALLEVYTNANNSGGGGEPGFPDDPWGVSLADGNGTMAWLTYESGMMAPIVVGKDPVKFRITLYDTGSVRKKDYPIEFAVSGLAQETYAGTIKVNVTEAPVLSFDQEELRISNVSSDYTGKATVNMLNEGAYKLNYSLRLDPSGHDENADDFEGGGDPSPAMNVIAHPTLDVAKQFTESCAARMQDRNLLKALGLKKVKDDQKFFYDIPEGLQDNVLYYPVLNPVSNAIAVLLGTGDNALDENFYAATRYEAPAEGFNLTHLYFVATVGNLENVDIEATVILGKDVTAEGRTIGHGKLHIDKEEPAANGSYQGIPRMLRFDNPIYINPADTFYVMLKYPAGYKSSALMATKDGAMEPNRYMAHLKSLGGWVDIEALYDNVQSTGAFGYFMTCIEHETGEPWIKLLNETTEGVVEAGESLPLNFQINAKSAYFAKNNKATLVVKTNDPENTLVNYHIYLDRNAAPMIEVPEGIVAANQGETTKVTLNVADAEEEAFTVAFSDNKGYTTVQSYNEADGVSYSGGTFSVPEGVQLEAVLSIAPEYGRDKVGGAAIAVKATDASNNVANATINYNVVFKNRAPEFIGQTDMSLRVGEQSAIIGFTSLFNDPDGDAFSCTAASADNDVATVYTSDEGFIIVAKKEGVTTVKVTATDASGATTQQDVTVTVSGASGINGVTTDDGTINVNANGNSLVVTVNGSVGKADISVYNSVGQLLAKKALKNLQAGDAISFDIATVPGVYTINLVLDGKSTTMKYAK